MQSNKKCLGAKLSRIKKFTATKMYLWLKIYSINTNTKVLVANLKDLFANTNVLFAVELNVLGGTITERNKTLTCLTSFSAVLQAKINPLRHCMQRSGCEVV